MSNIKTIVIILQSLDGFIARNQDDNLSWGSYQDKEHFRNLSKEIGVMILGSNTYRKMPESAFEERFTLVLTSTPNQFKDTENIVFRDFSPKESLDYLASLGYKQVAIAGGGKINNSFLKDRLVDEIYVTVAPKIFGTAIPSFGDHSLNIDLELLDYKKITQNELLLHYTVKN